MAQVGQQVGGGIGVFGYSLDGHNFSEDDILTSKDHENLGVFFNNPDAAIETESFLGFQPLNMNMDVKGGISAQSPNHMPIAVHTPNFIPNSAHDELTAQSTQQQEAAAHALSAMSNSSPHDHSHENSSGTMSPDANAQGAAAWGNISLQFGSAGTFAPGTEPSHLARHSSTTSFSYPHHPQHVAAWGYMGMPVGQQQHALAGAPSAGGMEAFNGNSPFGMIPPVQQQQVPSGSFNSRPNLMQYGSDPNIRANGYHSVNYSHQIDQKGGNLINVPYADQAANRGNHQLQQQANQRAYQRNDMANGSNAYKADVSSPRQLGGLPLGPASGSQPQQGGALNENTRKRCACEVDEEAGYAQGNIPSRGPKVPKAGEPSVGLSTPEMAKRRKSNAGSPVSPVDPASPGDNSAAKSRRSKSRQNLSEQEKRQNHILSEQRRRNIIKTGYAELDQLVPVLNGGKSGLSKADALKESITFLQNTMSGNELYMHHMNLDDTSKEAILVPLGLSLSSFSRSGN